MPNFICNFKGCKDLAQYQTGFVKGNYCHQHLRLLQKKNPQLRAFRIRYTPEEMKLINNFKFKYRKVVRKDDYNMQIVKKLIPYGKLKISKKEVNNEIRR